MRPPSVIVRRAVPNSHLQMPFVEWNQEVQTLPAKAAAELLADRVRHRVSHRRPQNPYTQIGKALVDFLGEDAVSIVDEESVRMIARQCGAPRLLDAQLYALRDVELAATDQRNLSPAWAEKYFDNHTEAFDYFERRRAEHPTGRVHRPVQSHEKPTVWAVCVDPV